MVWKIEFDSAVERDLKKLDRQNQRKILTYLNTKISVASDPKQFGKPLRGKYSGLWRYRVSDYRIVCKIEEDRLVVLVVRVAHRRKIYKSNIIAKDTYV